MNKISTWSPFAHLRLWLSPRNDFPNSYHKPSKRTGIGFVLHSNPLPTHFSTPKHTRLTIRAWFNHTVVVGLWQYISWWACFCCRGFKNKGVEACVCVCVCERELWWCVCFFKHRGTSVHILDINFYCNRKHLDQMLPCSEVTCGFWNWAFLSNLCLEAERERVTDY